ncbi:hypothetical protein SDC9_162762 [bioreactor metagenome]|uniref:Uncharacterized protein n=1 Tax=bioreactor metagenome TaxID=1076179 RepID=A0A645FPY5_9ZZZZ
MRARPTSSASAPKLTPRMLQEIPTPHRKRPVCGRLYARYLRSKSICSAARSMTSPMLTAEKSSTCPVAVESPALSRFFLRSSSGESKSACASSFMADSMAKIACGVPKPRMAPQGTLLVITAWESYLTLGMRYGPCPQVAIFQHTMGLSLTYAPPSIYARTSSACRIPPRFAPMRT